MEVEVPEAVDVLDFIGAGLARDEAVVVTTALAPVAQQPVVLHVAANRGIPRHRAEPRLLTRKGGEVVVVKLVAPAGVVLVLAVEGLGERGRDGWVRARVAGDLALEDTQGIGLAAHGVIPPLDRLEGEADGLARGGVSPRARRKLFEPTAYVLSLTGGRGQNRAEDLKAQTCPSHARRRVVVGGHDVPCSGPGSGSEPERCTPRGKNGVRPSSARRLGSSQPPQIPCGVGTRLGGQGQEPEQQPTDTLDTA